MNKLNFNEDILKSLEKAREVYGNKNQILVCMEELNELACVLAKYPRYADEVKATQDLHDKVLDEVADVMIILNHVQNIFGLSDDEVNNRVYSKIERLRRWLLHSDSMQETIDDRKVGEEIDNSPCKGCKRRNIKTEEQFMNSCYVCHQAQATDGTSPFYKGE